MTSSLSRGSQLENTKTDSLHLVFLPGLQGTAELFLALNSELKTKISSKIDVTSTLVTYPIDIPQSYPSLLKWLNQKLKLDEHDSPLILIAESFSSPLALILANTYPKKINGVILGSDFSASPVGSYLRYIPTIFLCALFSIKPPRFATQHFLTGSDSDEELVNQVRDAVSKIPAKILSERLQTVLHLTESPPIQTTFPILLLQAKKDALISNKAQTKLERYIPNASIQYLDTSHLIFQTQPKISAKHISTFIESVI